ncbi:hypothetical protein AVEN_272338-1 [Araneus ventricosus]|uniref:Uncharacterized protein n=1 Tax=Araneus ventricosus TaxID=182803 RepID=A0A4Y2GQ06_ARAVE|nr:hypothetical protein AVEN_272338-1 [Araneus ventricosus]
MGSKADAEEVSTENCQFSPQLIELYEAWHYHDGTKFHESIGLDVFFELRSEISIKRYCRPLDGTNNSSHYKQKAFPCEYPLLEVFSLIRKVEHLCSSSTVAILKCSCACVQLLSHKFEMNIIHLNSAVTF